MRRTTAAWLLMAAIVLGGTRQARASAYEFFGTGLRALSMGGAFIGKADDSTATYWNPAGLAQLKGRAIEFDLEKDSVSYADNNSIRNVNPERASIERNDVFLRWIPSEPRRFDEPKPKIFYAAGDSSGYYQWGKYTFGGAFYVPNGNYADRKDTVLDRQTKAFIRAKFYSRFFLSVANLSVAREVLPGVMLGGGVNVLYGSFLTNLDKHYLGGNRPELNNTYGIDSQGSGYGVEGVFGILLKPAPWLSLGAVYRTGANINVKGHFHILQTPIRDGNRVIHPGYDRASDYKQDFPLPRTFGAGIALTPFSPVTLTFDLQGTDWTNMKTEIDFEEQRKGRVEGRGPFPLSNLNHNLDWNLTLRYRVGAEYRVNDRLSVMCGYAYDENAVPDSRSSITNIIGFRMQMMSIGISYAPRRWGSYELDPWRIDLHYNHHRYYEHVEGQAIRGRDNMIGLGIGYHF
ncbi:MAG: outer membrane protein transport protein [Candidatus Tectomicrobia bacterium]|uniref:Outer membrane protein transport protein n=1 Tax=Tectimicrobiota bacterium TaxID=2528274 RepID=A0A932CRL5_UNCTE|nr:outer membrane protein transport protein [Candidatus Tectomicrobia bacterium]